MLKKIVKLGAPWCQPCKAFAPTFHRVEEMEEYKDIEFNDVDIDEDENGEELAEKYKVRAVPTVVLLDENDNVIYKLSGNVLEQELIDVINKAIKKE